MCNWRNKGFQIDTQIYVHHCYIQHFKMEGTSDTVELSACAYLEGNSLLWAQLDVTYDIPTLLPPLLYWKFAYFYGAEYLDPK